MISRSPYNWLGFFGLEDVKPLLAIPDDYNVLAIIPFGYPVRTVGEGRKRRKPLSDVASHGQFGQPFG